MEDLTIKQRLNLNSGDKSVPLRALCGEAYEEIDRLERQITAMRERLEIVWATDGAGERVPFRDGWPDGIECRDATIKLLEDARAKDAKYAEQQRLGFLALYNAATDYLCETRDHNGAPEREKMLAAMHTAWNGPLALAAPFPPVAQEPGCPICSATEKPDWCSGGPQCKFPGAQDTYTAPVPPGYRHDDRCAYRMSVRNHCTCGYVNKEGA